MIIASESGHFHITEGFTSAVEEVRVEQMEGLRVWPNPASHEITIQHPTQQIRKMRMYDLMGRVVRTTSMGPSQEITLDVSELVAGIYFVEVMDINGKRFVKQLVIGGK